jgi:serine/threonine-protein kinase
MFASRYRIERQLGKGGMGAVYLARQEPLSRLVAIKVLHGMADDVVVARFQREARLIAQLQHPHIVGLIDFGEEDGRLYLVMEYIDGEPLTALLKREAPLSPKRTCDIGIKIAEALAVAHDLQVVHRDVKPDNIMVLRSVGGQDFVKMLDFGVAKIKRDGEAQNTIETKAGLIVGSLRYISPEQVESGEITPRTDIYSFGCILYEMLCGRRVFEYPSPADCAIAHLTESPRPPAIEGRAMRGPLVDLIMRCLEKKPSRRPADARAALKALMGCGEKPAEIEAEVVGARTKVNIDGGLDLAQGTRTIEARPATLPPVPAVVPDRPPTARGPVELRAPQGGQDQRMPDIELRQARGAIKAEGPLGPPRQPSALALPQARPEGQKPAQSAQRAPSRQWRWALVGLVVIGAVGATVFALIRGDTSEGRVDARLEDTASSSGDVPSSVIAAAPQGAEVAAAEAELASGTRIVTVPQGASVLREGRPACTTPCIVSWSKDEKPPLLRLVLSGHVDVDVQLLAAERGTEQRFNLSPITR